MYQLDYIKATDQHRREELARSWAGHHRPGRRTLLTRVLGGRRSR